MKMLNKPMKDIRILEDVKKYYAEHSASGLFWRGMVYVVYIVIACINFQAALIISGLGSLLFLGAIFDELDDVFWGPLTFIFWIGGIAAGGIYLICCLGMFIYNTTIKPFNDWLDKLKK